MNEKEKEAYGIDDPVYCERCNRKIDNIPIQIGKGYPTSFFCGWNCVIDYFHSLKEHLEEKQTSPADTWFSTALEEVRR